MPASRRELGSVYTPPAIAGKISRACLDRWFEGRVTFATNPCTTSLRVLDPACGDGAFLLEVFDELCRRSGETTRHQSDLRLEIVRQHLFGVDIDPTAVETLRAKLVEQIAATGELAAIAAAVVDANIRCGDSLSGADFSPTRQPPASGRRDTVAVTDWRRDFPTAAAAGGFDVIVGNPPYLRERNAKALFDQLAATELGRRWREARMDLWFYFVHRSLDLLRPGGILSFIVNSYWISSRGAAKLIDRLRCEAQLEEIELLDDAPLFKTVAGRHMIFRLRKRSDTRLEPLNASRDAEAACRIVISPNRPKHDRKRNGRAAHDSLVPEYQIPLGELYQYGRIVVAPSSPTQNAFRNRQALADSFDTRQGMAENPPIINRGLAHRFPGRYETGEGVFVLRTDEVERLQLTPAERALLRPYYELAACGRYRLANDPTHHVLYLTRRTAPHLDDLPHIAAHLERFRPILDLRRETREGKCAWWQLHWPREEDIFVRPRVLSIQMGERPQFVFAERPTFVGFSINLVLACGRSGIALDVLTGILNSDLARTWFERHAKRRGLNLEINAHLLRQVPLPGRSEKVELQIGELVRARQAISENDDRTVAIERQIEELVERLYDVERWRGQSGTSQI